jgi:hypothetical protein
MQAVLGTLEHYSSGQSRKLAVITHAVGNWLSDLFGCQHRELSRPFSRHGESYRVCIACGAHRRFDAASWNSRGPFYYRVANTSDLLQADCSAVKRLTKSKFGH